MSTALKRLKTLLSYKFYHKCNFTVQNERILFSRSNYKKDQVLRGAIGYGGQNNLESTKVTMSRLKLFFLVFFVCVVVVVVGEVGPEVDDILRGDVTRLKLCAPE